MCSFIYGKALTKPVLGIYFELPKKYPPKRNLIFDEAYKDITDVFAYRYIDTEKYVVKDIHIYKDLDELLSTIRHEQRQAKNRR